MGNKSSVWLLSIILLVFYFFVLIAVGYEGLIGVYIVLALTGSAALIGARYLIKQEASVTLRGVGAEYGLRVARHALFATEDNLFGFPSGKFEVVDGETPHSLLAKEFQPPSSHRLVLNMLLIPWSIAGVVVVLITRITNSGWAFIIGQVVRVFAFIYFMFMFIVPLLLAVVVEMGLKKIAGSVITVQAIEGENEVQLAFTFRGASALLVKSGLLKSFEAPALPAKYHTAAMAQASQALLVSAAA